jgi:hypothetical protein
MNRSLRLCIVAALLFGGGTFAAAPLNRDWIELRFGLAPDGGSGVFELMLAALSLLVAATLALRAIAGSRSSRIKTSKRFALLP